MEAENNRSKKEFFLLDLRGIVGGSSTSIALNSILENCLDVRSGRNCDAIVFGFGARMSPAIYNLSAVSLLALSVWFFGSL